MLFNKSSDNGMHVSRILPFVILFLFAILFSGSLKANIDSSITITKVINGEVVEEKTVVMPERNHNRYMVELYELPVMKRPVFASHREGKDNSQQLKNAVSSLKQTQSSFANKLIISDRVDSVEGSNYLIYNHLVVTASKGQIDQLKRDPTVKSITLSMPVSANLTSSVSRVNADSAWLRNGADENSLTGHGIDVAVLDTGIWYQHSAFGNCTAINQGDSCRITKGIDTISGTDGIDSSNGHGTHVAGIIGGRSEQGTGVAPDANLWAVKVLNDAGQGYTDTIIAGIEFALDPNSDGDTSDRADIMNLSLGGPGSVSDPLTIAVNAAVDAGIVAVVAAGNEGEPRTISTHSPANAEKAITVSSSDKSDLLSYFSSLGGATSATVKPEIIAPGSGIYAPFPNEQWQTLSGTSMAAPHVAGAAALLLQSEPELTPTLIKSKLISGAQNINLHALAQGFGRLDITGALDAKLLVSEVRTFMGRYTPGSGGGQKTLSFSITNASGEAKDISIELPQFMPQSITFSIDTPSFTLPAGETREVSVNATWQAIDSSLIPYDQLGAFSDRIRVVSGEQLLSVPVSLEMGYEFTVSVQQDESTFVYLNLRDDEGTNIHRGYIYSGESLNLLLSDKDHTLAAHYSYSVTDLPQFNFTHQVGQILGYEDFLIQPSQTRGILLGSSNLTRLIQVDSIIDEAGEDRVSQFEFGSISFAARKEYENFTSGLFLSIPNYFSTIPELAQAGFAIGHLDDVAATELLMTFNVHNGRSAASADALDVYQVTQQIHTDSIGESINLDARSMATLHVYDDTNDEQAIGLDSNITQLVRHYNPFPKTNNTIKYRSWENGMFPITTTLRLGSLDSRGMTISIPTISFDRNDYPQLTSDYNQQALKFAFAGYPFLVTPWNNQINLSYDGTMFADPWNLTNSLNRYWSTVAKTVNGMAIHKLPEASVWSLFCDQELFNSGIIESYSYVNVDISTCNNLTLRSDFVNTTGEETGWSEFAFSGSGSTTELNSLVLQNGEISFNNVVTESHAELILAPYIIRSGFNIDSVEVAVDGGAFEPVAFVNDDSYFSEGVRIRLPNSNGQDNRLSLKVAYSALTYQHIAEYPNLLTLAASSVFDNDLDNDGVLDDADPDIDGDGVSNDDEITIGTNPRIVEDGQLDLDGDGLSNSEEAVLGTNYLLTDTDNDGIDDGADLFANDPLRWTSVDTDGDGVTDDTETLLHFDINDASDVWQDDDGDRLPLLLERLESREESQADNNVFGNSRLLVYQAYIDMAHRFVSDEEFNLALNQLNDGQTPFDIYVAALDDSSLARLGLVGRIYQALLNRAPDQEGLNYFRQQLQNGNMSESEVVAGFIGSDEFLSRYGNLSNGEFVELVYQNVLGRIPDETGLAYWVLQLDFGTIDQSNLMLGFITSQEFIDREDVAQRLNGLSLVMANRSLSQDDINRYRQWVESEGNYRSVIRELLSSQGYREQLLTGVSDATADSDADGRPDGLEFAQGFDVSLKDNDVLNNDVLFVQQTLRDILGYRLSLSEEATQLSALQTANSRSDWVASLISDERVNRNRNAIIRLYNAILGRRSERGGLVFWIERYESGTNTLEDIANAFVGSGEFQSTYGTLSNGDFVNLVYQNVLGRAGDSGGVAYWTSQLDSSAISRGGLMIGFSESQENADLTLNRDRVVVLYTMLLARDPSDAEFVNVISFLETGTGFEFIVNLMINSGEYQDRFY